MRKIPILLLLSLFWTTISFSDHKGGVAEDFECVNGYVHLRWANFESEYFEIVLPKRKCKYTVKEMREIENEKIRNYSLLSILAFLMVIFIPARYFYKKRKNR